MDMIKIIIFPAARNRQNLPWNEPVELGEHLVHFDPVLQIPRTDDMITFIHHDPAHVRRAVFAGGTIARGGRAASMNRLQVGCPAVKMNQAANGRLPVIQRFGHRGTFAPAEASAQHYAGGNHLMIIFAGNDRLRIPLQHLVHLHTQITKLTLPPVKSVHALIIGQKLQMHF